MADGPEHPLQVGDFVCHTRWDGDSDGDNQVGYVVGFAPSRNWVRIKTLDGRNRVWARSHLHNVDAESREGNYAS